MVLDATDSQATAFFFRSRLITLLKIKNPQDSQSRGFLPLPEKARLHPGMDRLI